MIEDLRITIETNPSSIEYEVGVGFRDNAFCGEILFKWVGSFNWDENNEFFLIPEGLGSAYNLEEQKMTAIEMLQSLEAKIELHEFVSYVRHKFKKLIDSGTVCLNLPVWGTGMNNDSKLIYFYYGGE